MPVEGDARGPAADYLRDCLVAALSQTIEGGKAIMAWLQSVAYQLAEAGHPFEWTTPTGSTVRQAYYVTIMRRIQTLCGTLAIDDSPDTVTLSARKQHLAAAPNYVHSFDAAHLALTVNACVEEGITSFAMIHDSYGTHAADTTAMGRLLRDTFVRIYQEDWLMKLYEEIRVSVPGVPIPKPPARGDLEIGRVVDAEFFFA